MTFGSLTLPLYRDNTVALPAVWDWNDGLLSGNG